MNERQLQITWADVPQGIGIGLLLALFALSASCAKEWAAAAHYPRGSARGNTDVLPLLSSWAALLATPPARARHAAQTRRPRSEIGGVPFWRRLRCRCKGERYILEAAVTTIRRKRAGR
jgi:hypothetical protein